MPNSHRRRQLIQAVGLTGVLYFATSRGDAHPFLVVLLVAAVLYLLISLLLLFAD